MKKEHVKKRILDFLTTYGYHSKNQTVHLYPEDIDKLVDLIDRIKEEAVVEEYNKNVSGYGGGYL